MVFPMADKVLTAADNKELADKFAEVNRAIGLETIARLETFAKSLAMGGQSPLPGAAQSGGGDCECGSTKIL